jgi:hypothetical protein
VVPDPSHGVRVVAAAVNVVLVAAAVIGLVVGRAGAAEPVIRSRKDDMVADESVVNIRVVPAAFQPGRPRADVLVRDGFPNSGHSDRCDVVRRWDRC